MLFTLRTTLFDFKMASRAVTEQSSLRDEVPILPSRAVIPVAVSIAVPDAIVVETASSNSLTKGQQQFIDLAKSGKNIFLTGSAGVGKSFIVENYYEYANNIYKGRVWKTALTGIAALNIGGKTIHSWAGVKLAEGSPDFLIKEMFFKIKRRWRTTKVLFIDEISMMGPELLEKLNKIAQLLRNNSKPFGGIQLIMVGDFFQLRPVKNPKFAFESKCWNFIVNETVIMNEIVRQTDMKFQEILNEIRHGDCSTETQEIFQSRVGVNLTTNNGIEPTRLYPKNRSVDTVNNSKLKALPGEAKVFKAEYYIKHNSSSQNKKFLFEYLRKNTPIKDTIYLKIGAQIVFKQNIPEWNVVNGSKGCVKSFSKYGNPIVETINLDTIVVLPTEFTYERIENEEENIKFCAVKKQLPLKLAWASSIHSSQGTTLELVSIDCGENVFDYGMSYVALSRVKTLEGLSLISFDPFAIEANQRVIDFYARLEREDTAELKQTDSILKFFEPKMT